MISAVISPVLAFAPGAPRLHWNLVADWRELFSYPFMVNAYRAGTIVAILAGVVGWFVVLRRQTFASHTIAVVGFPGAAGAVLAGWSASLGYYAAAVVAAVVIGALRRRGREPDADDPAVTGTVQAVALATGFALVTRYGGLLGSTSGLLFGSFLGITATQVGGLAIGAALTLGALAAMARPLLFASVDADVAAARGVPVRALSIAFLVVLGVAAAAVSQVTGSLLVFALLVLPAATAQAISSRPGRSLVMAVALALLTVWVALLVAYYSTLPIGFVLTTAAFLPYGVVTSAQRLAR